MSIIRVGAIVEGHGEVRAVPILIRRIAAEWDPAQGVEVRPVSRAPASALKKEGILESDIENVTRKLGGGAVLVLLDCDWDGGCPKYDGPEWLQRSRAAHPHIPIRVVFAYREFEAWFIAAAESLRGYRRLSQDLVTPSNPEGIRDAKGWLRRHMPRMAPYSAFTDQPAFTAMFDMGLARRNAPSFDKCYREIVGLLEDASRGAASAR